MMVKTCFEPITAIYECCHFVYNVNLCLPWQLRFLHLFLSSCTSNALNARALFVYHHERYLACRRMLLLLSLVLSREICEPEK